MPHWTHKHDFESIFPKLVSLVAKIDRWWIENVDIAINQDLTGKEFDEDEVTPGSLVLLQVLNQVALGKNDEAWALYNELMTAHEDTKT